MGNNTSNTEIVPTWDVETVLAKLQAFPIKTNLTDIQTSNQFAEWVQKVNVEQVVDLLLGRDFFSNKHVKAFHIACAFVSLLEIFNPESLFVTNRRSTQNMDEVLISSYFYLVINKYLTSLKRIPSNAVTKITIGQLLFSLGWVRLRRPELQMLKERIFSDKTELGTPLVEYYPEIFQHVDPGTDLHLYPKIREASKNALIRDQSWRALSKFGHDEDKERILKMLKKGTEGFVGPSHDFRGGPTSDPY
eukprot:TRINITY_DN5849_c0_g1_i1.p1 TRINITY_DN5849_c0_g1~~TRINITY_DN5849_c0_g1_i1.p1  ORF type:complete len:248 (+),score=41.58 TRINITY_DN5849_c0_g1_i1:32-775(+)